MKKLLITLSLAATAVCWADPETTIHPAVEVTWPSAYGIVYHAHYSTNLVSTNWFNLGGTIVGDGSTMSLFDTTQNDTERYYRVMEGFAEGERLIFYKNNGSFFHSFVFGTNGTLTANFDGEVSQDLGNYTFQYTSSTTSVLTVDYPIFPDSETTYSFSWTNELGGNYTAAGETTVTGLATFQYIPIP